jgi:hypothetical protein
MSTHLTTVDRAELAPATDSDVSGLVRLAIEQKVPVEVLERLVALQERVTERNARAAFFEAVAAFQEECPPITKSREARIETKSGGAYKYNYAPLEEITQTIRPYLKRHGLSYSWEVEDGGKALSVVCVLRHIEGHSERSGFPVPVDTSARMSDAQKNGAAQTYGKRQSLLNVLGITTADEDKDAARQEAAGADTITDAQAADLDALIDEVGANRQKFLEWLHVDALDELPKRDYRRAVQALENKRGQ